MAALTLSLCLHLSDREATLVRDATKIFKLWKQLPIGLTHHPGQNSHQPTLVWVHGTSISAQNRPRCPVVIVPSFRELLLGGGVKFPTVLPDYKSSVELQQKCDIGLLPSHDHGPLIIIVMRARTFDAAGSGSGRELSEFNARN